MKKIFIFSEDNISLVYRESILSIINIFFKFFFFKNIKTVNIYFLDPKNMEALNFKFRGYCKTTDSISIKKINNFYIFFCFNYIIYKSLFFNKNLIFEFVLSLIHSVLHNLDYDHELSFHDLKKQNKVEKKIFYHFLELNRDI